MDNPRYNFELIVLLYSFCCWIIFPSVSMSTGVLFHRDGVDESDVSQGIDIAGLCNVDNSKHQFSRDSDKTVELVPSARWGQTSCSAYIADATEYM